MAAAAAACGRVPPPWSVHRRTSGQSSMRQQRWAQQERAAAFAAWHTPLRTFQLRCAGPHRQTHNHPHPHSHHLHRRRRTLVRTHASSSFSQPHTTPTPNTNQSSLLTPFTRFLSSNFLPLALLSALGVGWSAPSAGQAVAARGGQQAATAGIFLISGMCLAAGEMRTRVVKEWRAWGYCVIMVLVATPILALAALRLPIEPKELATGLALFCCMPTALSTGVSLTQAVGGNTPLALAVTVGTNILGCATVPWVLAGVLGRGMGVTLDPTPLLRNLVYFTLLPLLTGMLLRATMQGVERAVQAHRKKFSLASTILLVPWQQVSLSSRALSSRLSPASLLSCAAAGLAVHVAYLALNALMINVPGVVHVEGEDARGTRRAVLLVASQKTLAIAAAVVPRLPAAAGEPGLLIVPCMAAHLMQILVDSAIVAKWIRQDEQERLERSGVLATS
eukprot:jgi/Chlat1/2083/Chrsp17S02633